LLCWLFQSARSVFKTTDFQKFRAYDHDEGVFMPSLTKPCPGGFAETVHVAYRNNPSLTMQQEFACSVCGQSIGLTLIKGSPVPVAHWPNVPRRQESNRLTSRYSRYRRGVV
jgi:hypothetical protein